MGIKFLVAKPTRPRKGRKKVKGPPPGTPKAILAKAALWEERGRNGQARG